MREAQEAVPLYDSGEGMDRIVLASDPGEEPYQTVTVYYESCMSSRQLAQVRDTEGLQLAGIHQSARDGVRVRFRYYPEGGEQ